MTRSGLSPVRLLICGLFALNVVGNLVDWSLGLPTSADFVEAATKIAEDREQLTEASLTDDSGATVRIEWASSDTVRPFGGFEIELH